ncbi:MAG: hypothetical protein J6A92_06200 [Lachnospiraceae bacterium]|nr:hypothetical protein [Lachnospiraceae bacterium]
MKSKTSCFNKTIFKKNMSRFWAIWLIILLWNLFVLPCNIFINYLHRTEWIEVNATEAEIAAQKVNEIAGLVGVYMNPTILFIFSLAAAMAVFSYLYTFRAANTIHALPVTRKELFITNYLSGLTFLVVPILVGFLIGIIVGAACGYTCLDYIFKGMLYALGMSFFFYNFAVFVAMVAGTLAAVPVFTFILNYLYVGCKLLVGLVQQSISYGVSIQFHEGILDVLSPLYYIQNKVDVRYDYTGKYPVCEGIFGGNVVIGYAIAAIPFIIAAYMIYKKRDVETAGNLISVSWIAPVFRWGCAFCSALLLGVFACQLISSKSATAEFVVLLISALIFGSVIFFCVQMMLEKGFRVFKKKRFAELGAFLIVLCASLFAVENDWFGIEKKMPDTENIARAYIYCGYPIGGDAQEDISAVLEIHKQCIENKELYENAIANVSQEDKLTSFTVKYILKDGNAFERSYTVPENAEESAYQYVKSYTLSPEGYLKNQFGIQHEGLTMEAGGIDLYNTKDDYQYHDFTREEAQQVYEAVIADLEAGNMDEVIEHYQWYDEEYESMVYYNSIGLEYASEEKIRNVVDEYYGEDEEFVYGVRYGNGSYSGSTNVEFTANCKNIIQTLIDIGAINSEEDLLTIEEQRKLEEE